MFQGMEYVYAVYQERSFSRAAKKLFISQPSLSATIKRIEAKIGYPIFDRSTKPLTLTECGEKYILAVEQMLSSQKEFITFINDWGKLMTGRLSLGGSSLYSSWILPSLMGEFTRRFPMVKVELIEENTAELAALLQSGRIDLMLDNCLLDSAAFGRRVFLEEHLFLAVPAACPVNEIVREFQISADLIKDRSFSIQDHPPVPLKYFAKEAFIMLKHENDTRKRAMELLQAHHITPNILFELDQQLTTYHVTSSGMGISFVSDTLIKKVPANPNVVYYNLECSRNLYFYWKSGRYFSRAMEEFLSCI